MLLVYALAGRWAWACGEPPPKVWDVGSAISVTITAPSNNSVVAAGGNVSCTATASDSDHWTQGASSGNEADTIASYTWTASAGTFPNGNTGASVTWTAPTTTGNVTITCTVNDPPGPHVPPGDTGTRDDSPKSKSVTVDVQAIVWDPYPAGGGISCNGITAPASQYGYACNSDVTCTIAEAHDQDHRHEPPSNDTYPNDAFTYTWSATAGTFPNGNSGQTVTWRAPNTPSSSVEITCRVDDVAQIPEGETGDRDDGYEDYPVTVKAYKVRCLQIDATYDVNIYWPNEPHYADKVWAANTDVYAASGAIEEIWHRERIADVFHVEPPEQQHYKLTCTLARYPACTTDQTMSTHAVFLSSSDDQTGWSPEFTVNTRSSIGRRSYQMGFTFKVGDRQVENTQTVPGDGSYFIDYAIYGSPLCPSDKFTNDHLYYACEWGDSQTTLATISHKVMTDINGAITDGCICPGEWSTAWSDTVWDNAIPGSGSAGMCCCRAHGMMLAAEVLGLGTYTHVYVNERAEPGAKATNPSTPVYCAECDEYCVRGSWWGGFWNNYEGACRSGASGSTCYAPAGEFEGTYNEIRSSFGPYYWTWGGSYDNRCPHLSPP